MFFEGQPGVICSDLQVANQVQISANQRAEKHSKRQLANHVICSDLQGANQVYLGVSGRESRRIWVYPGVSGRTCGARMDGNT